MYANVDVFYISVGYLYICKCLCVHAASQTQMFTWFSWKAPKWGSRVFPKVNGAVTQLGHEKEKDHRLASTFLHSPAELARSTIIKKVHETNSLVFTWLQNANHPKELTQYNPVTSVKWEQLICITIIMIIKISNNVFFFSCYLLSVSVPIHALVVKKPGTRKWNSEPVN